LYIKQKSGLKSLDKFKHGAQTSDQDRGAGRGKEEVKAGIRLLSEEPITMGIIGL
jgi:hypothetical protein